MAPNRRTNATIAQPRLQLALDSGRHAGAAEPDEPHGFCEFLPTTVRAEPTDDDIAIVAVGVD